MVSEPLPVEAALPQLRAALAGAGVAVLQAPPGAGKSTRVPLVLLDEPWSAGRRVVMLEPRRVAARAVAARMAQSLGEAVGATVGYRMRLDTRVSRATRLEVVTEGVLTRLLQEDPALEGIAAVIFDEFHERSLQADLGLALTLDARAQLSPRLRLLVMSATLDGGAVARLLGDAPLISATGRQYPVEVHYAGRGGPLLPTPGLRAAPAVEPRVAALIARVLREDEGDVLVFLPGAPEIRRVQALLQSGPAAHSARVLPLYGELTAAQQDAALAADASARKVVLATNIAETSLTIPGVRVIVDAGLVRRSHFDPVTGMSHLATVAVSQASAQQRAGRAGRTGPGVCYRLWSEGAQASLAPFAPPEILAADLAPLALELAGWGTRDPGELRWLDPPPAAPLAAARGLLQRLGALDDDGRVTAHGREMGRFAAHPRIAHMLLRARGGGRAVSLAARLAALLGERDLLRGSGDADIRTRLERLDGEATGADRATRATLARVRQSVRDFERRVALLPRAAGSGNNADSPAVPADPGALLALAFPDRIARRRPGEEGRYLLANGRGAVLTLPQTLSREEFLVAVDVDDRDRDARILLAAPLAREHLQELFARRIQVSDSVVWNSREQAVLARRLWQLDALVIADKPLAQIPGDAALEVMLQGVGEMGIAALPWDPPARDLQARMQFVRGRALPAGEAQAWPDVSDEALARELGQWLAPWLQGLTRRDHLARLPLQQALRARLSPAQQRELDQFAPATLTMPTGSHIRVDYVDEGGPSVSVRLQEVFGLAETPRLGRAQVPVTFKLLSPAQRPVQVTRDLGGFWRGSYAQVRKELRGRYPKHHWPEDPLTAAPSRGARRRG
ncbi:MAG: ATP-dependent helicase HrpB [Proteobacteria bacterium]|nr:ATP-dependent helicase HrpB [Pseudomonadota bacterium]